MRWQKLGRLFVPDGSIPWMHSHATLPTAVHLNGDEFRVYFSSRDPEGRSHVGYADVDVCKGLWTGGISEQPIISPGPLGRFDYSGATISWVVERDETEYFYYVGWNLAIEVPFRNALGLVIRNRINNNQLRKLPGPVLDRSPVDPCFVAAASILVDGSLWRMWYLSCTEWEINGDQLRHKYHIKYAESTDGIWWSRDGRICIDFADDSEYAISRPSVVRDKDGYHMWYSWRGEKYRIGYASSSDGLSWTRRDREAGISVSPGQWDGDMIEYPFVFDHAGRRYMLYNGDGYGLSGFGLAVLEDYSPDS